jgi:hypothetical protein
MKKYFLKGNQVWFKGGDDKDGTYRPAPTVFIQIKGELACGKCKERLGPLTDDGIENNSEYHSCPC